jgi:hypothetical protein
VTKPRRYRAQGQILEGASYDFTAAAELVGRATFREAQPVIINVRGTHGSGKSTLMRRLMATHAAEPHEVNTRGRPVAYVMAIPKCGDVFVIGSYENPCGGCDVIQPKSDVWPLVERFAAMGHVLFEGVLISTTYGAVGHGSEYYGDQFIFAYLDTPVEVCIDRVRQRRRAKGNLKPFNPELLKQKHALIKRQVRKFAVEHGRRVVILDHLQPEAALLALLPKSPPD